MALPRTASQALFSLAYVRAIVAAAGMQVDVPEIDYDSLDGRISYTGSLEGVYSPSIGFQLKSTSQKSKFEPDCIKQRLSIKNYDDLRAQRPGRPRILIVVYLPGAIRQWTAHTETNLLLRRCGYWTSLEGAPAVRAGQKTVVARVPRSQCFSVVELKMLMRRFVRGEFP